MLNAVQPIQVNLLFPVHSIDLIALCTFSRFSGSAYLPDNIAHKYSDEYCNVSITDQEATLAAARALKIDGVISFACDPGVVMAAYVAEKMGLPCVGSYDAVSLLQNKGRLRNT